VSTTDASDPGGSRRPRTAPVENRAVKDIRRSSFNNRHTLWVLLFCGSQELNGRRRKFLEANGLFSTSLPLFPATKDPYPAREFGSTRFR
jgi:hypothetical protein